MTSNAWRLTKRPTGLVEQRLEMHPYTLLFRIKEINKGLTGEIVVSRGSIGLSSQKGAEKRKQVLTSGPEWESFIAKTGWCRRFTAHSRRLKVLFKYMFYYLPF